MTKDNSQQSSGGSNIQEQLNIAEIKDGAVVLRDGSLRAVLAVSSINFDLKSTTEQEAIIYAFQRFLNILDYPVQILISTRKFDAKPYLAQLEERKKTEKNSLLRGQIEDYAGFIRDLITASDISSKNFYLIVPYYPVEIGSEGIIDRIMSKLRPQKRIYQKREQFETYKNQLFQRVEESKEALSGMGVWATMLSTQQLIEMYYNFYNPSAFEHVSIAADELLLD